MRVCVCMYTGVGVWGSRIALGYLLTGILLVHLLFISCYAQHRSAIEGAIFWSFTCILRGNTFVAELLVTA